MGVMKRLLAMPSFLLATRSRHGLHWQGIAMLPWDENAGDAMKRLLAIVISGLLVGAAVLTSGQGPELPVEAASNLPLALGAIHPRISPDGKTIAVSYQGAIWTMPQAGGT